MGLETAQQEVVALMTAFRAGDSAASGRLIEIFYPELKRLATRQMLGERKEHSWQPTLLVNELYLELVRIKALPSRQEDSHNERAAFFALAGRIMHRLLVGHARLSSSRTQKMPLEDIFAESDSSLVEVEQLLSRLGSIKPVIRTVVEMKVFEGLTAEEIAPRIGCAVVTVNRYWQFARQWLRRELGEAGPPHGAEA